MKASWLSIGLLTFFWSITALPVSQNIFRKIEMRSNSNEAAEEIVALLTATDLTFAEMIRVIYEALWAFQMMPVEKKEK